MSCWAYSGLAALGSPGACGCFCTLGVLLAGVLMIRPSIGASDDWKVTCGMRTGGCAYLEIEQRLMFECPYTP